MSKNIFRHCFGIVFRYIAVGGKRRPLVLYQNSHSPMADHALSVARDRPNHMNSSC